jgi:ribosomal protein L11 methyltransferase
MSWWAIDVRTAPDDRAAVGAWLVARTGYAVEERDDGLLVGFAADPGDAARVLAELPAAGAEAAGAPRPVEPVDWSERWRDGLGARRFGRLTVAPSWVPIANDAGPIVVLDPEMAFGSGEHGSTRSALTLLERHIRPGNRVLDLGSGSGILAIAAVKLGAARAIGIETDGEANEVAERNASRNGVGAAVRFLEGDGAVLAPLMAPAELICSNILRSVNTALLPPIAASLAPRGIAIFAGMEQPEADEFRPALAEAGFTIVEEASDTGWWGVAALLA